jgi:hypothetical protein
MVITLFDTLGFSGLVDWAQEFGINHPVVLDSAAQEGKKYNPDGAIPSMTLLKPGAEIVILDQPTISEEEILPYLE